MATLSIRCPSCKGGDLQKSSKRQGKEFYKCAKTACNPREFRLEYTYEEQLQAEPADVSPRCPECQGKEIRKFGKKQGAQIYRCNNSGCSRTTFRQKYTYKAWDPNVKSRIQELVAEGNSARAISRLLSVSKDTVLKIKEDK
ncbi:MAG: hypothetical protein FWE44_01800 [Defluviitaleaceae bacterium]|nr:hypothetical protein [Defluviitaleaceae bacterium]